MCDNFADHNTGGIGVWVVGPGRMLQLKSFVGLKKYTSDPSSMSSTLFGHHFGLVGELKTAPAKSTSSIGLVWCPLLK